jgi:glutaredoxin
MIATVWTQPNCPYCDTVKKSLTEHGYSIVERDIMQMSDFIRQQFKDKYKTTPQVFIGQTHVGDCTQTVAWLEGLNA